MSKEVEETKMQLPYRVYVDSSFDERRKMWRLVWIDSFVCEQYTVLNGQLVEFI